MLIEWGTMMVSDSNILAEQGAPANGLPSYQHVLQVSSNRTIVMGNGAGCALSRKYAFQSLYVEARRLELLDQETIACFEQEGSQDFERVMQRLRSADWLARHPDPLGRRVLALRDAFIKTIAAHHVEWRDVNAGQFQAFLAFLSAFQAVYTLNHDLLLDWTRNHNQWRRFDDGFTRQYRDDMYGDLQFKDPTFVRAMYPHGALHLYESGGSTFSRR